MRIIIIIIIVIIIIISNYCYLPSAVAFLSWPLGKPALPCDGGAVRFRISLG